MRAAGWLRGAVWLLLPLLLLLAARSLVAETFLVPSASMSPTLEPRDHVLANKLAYRFGSPRVGDLAVFEDPRGGDVLVKRVVATGGERVEIRDGVLFVDRKARHEPYVDQSRVDGFFFGPATVPVGELFVLGDNRGESEDSRSFGPVERRQVIGRVDLRIPPVAELLPGRGP